MQEQKTDLRSSLLKAWKDIFKMLPLLLGTILLIGLTSLIPKSYYSLIFRGNILDILIGSIIGSVSAGNPIMSYILGGEFLKQGVSLLAVTSFLVAWVTVGVIQLPAESMILGKKFAITRNILSFISAIIIAIITVALCNIF